MRTKIKDKLWILLIILAVMSYILTAINLIYNNKYVLWTINNANIDGGIIYKIFPYLKDIIAIFLFIVLALNNKKNLKIILIFVTIVCLGSMIIWLNNGNDNDNLLYIIAGIRMLLYFIVAMMYCLSVNDYKLVSLKLFKVIKVMILVEFFIVYIQIMRSENIHNIGNGAYRFCGTFGNAAGLAYFCIAACLYILIYKNIFNNGNGMKKNYVYYALIMALVLATGSRTGILSCIIIIFMYIINELLKSNIISKKNMYIFVMILTIFIIPLIYNLMIKFVNRGALMDSGATRIDIFLLLFDLKNTNFLKFIFGYGIGYGTNNAVILGIKNASIIDSTFGTIMVQYGILGLGIFIITLFYIVKKVFRYSSKCGGIFTAIAYIVPIFLVTIAGNIFEQIVLAMLLCYMFYCMKNNYYIKQK